MSAMHVVALLAAAIGGTDPARPEPPERALLGRVVSAADQPSAGCLLVARNGATAASSEGALLGRTDRRTARGGSAPPRAPSLAAAAPVSGSDALLGTGAPRVRC